MISKLYWQDKSFLQRSQLKEVVHLKELFSLSGMDTQDLFALGCTGRAARDDGAYFGGHEHNRRVVRAQA